MKKIYLSSNSKCQRRILNLFAEIDDDDFNYINQWKWQARKDEHRWYASMGKKEGLSTMMHRVILGLTDPKIIVDHIDRNGLNNKKSNLRICSNSENCRNRKLISGKSSKYMGVCFHKKTKKWYASIGKDWKTIYLGIFKNEADAARAYDEAAKIHFGEFANLNFKEL